MAQANPNASPQTNFQLAAHNKLDTSVKAEAFWVREPIDATRWNKAYPYQLLVLRRSGQGYAADPKWTFTLPIPPEALSVSMPITDEPSATLGGIVEEGGGAPFRSISIQSTTGHMPLRGSQAQLRSFNPLQAVFAGTITSSTSAFAAARNIANSTGGGTFPTPNLLTADEVSGDVASTTGYYQFRLLQQWIEAYQALRRTDRTVRLGIAMWKDQSVYVCTPKLFEYRKTGQSPLEYTYSLLLKAWRRIHLDGPGALLDPFTPTARDPNLLAQLLDAVQVARRALQGVRASIQAVAGDIDQALFEPLRQLSLFAKDALGVPLALADLPTNVILEAKGPIVAALALPGGFDAIADRFDGLPDAVQQAAADVASLGASTGKGVTRDGDPASFDPALSSAPANAIFEDPDSNFDFFNALRPGDLNLPPAVTKLIVQERERVRLIRRLDFEQLRDTVIQRMCDYADACGAGDATFSQVYGRQPPPATSRQPNDDDFEALNGMNEVAIQLNALAATGKTDRFKLSAMEYVAGLASAAGMSFVVPNSKLRVPFPYGSTLEQLAAQYLGDRDRWIEIASLNNLRAPYIDEEGFDLPLLAAGSGNSLAVADGSNLYVGQQAWISATNTPRAIRRITDVRQLAPGQWVVQVDGDPDMSRFTTQALASLHAFLPGTVNSQMTIWIPSSVVPDQGDDEVKDVPGVDYSDPYLEVGGIDLLLTQQRDLVLTPDVDCRFAVGLTNIVQKASIRANIPRGGLPRHPTVGLAVDPGTSVADLDARQMAAAARDLFADDPTFTRVTSVAIKIAPPATTIGLTVGIAGTKQEVPLSFVLG